MSQLSPPRPSPVDAAWVIEIVASRYNAEFVDGMISGARKELALLAPNTKIVVHEVPGAFEIPLAVQAIAEQGDADAVLAFGLIWEGETRHADLIATAVTNGLMQLTLKFHLPILHEVLVVQNEAQARARCLDPKNNRGIEAARAAVDMISTLVKIQTSPL